MTDDEAKQTYRAMGLMSGTSLDGIDAALIETDGETVSAFGPSLTVPYDDAFKDRLHALLGPAGRNAPTAEAVERDLTIAHADAVDMLLHRAGLTAADIDLIGFHGHTLHHDPAAGVTVQLGDGALLAARTGVSVACDFRTADVARGGEGAPLVPVFHAALVRANADIRRPACVLNIGGVANVTWVGAPDDALLAFDTGPGNAGLNDWVCDHVGQPYDDGGQYARAGTPDAAAVAEWLAHPYFDRPPPKSLDRQDFAAIAPEGLGLEDGAATLTAFIVGAVARACEHFPAPPETWIVTGGGRHNPQIMQGLSDHLGTDVRRAEAVGWDGDALEAQAFAFLAVRTVRGLPITFPTTTGAPEPLCGGRVFRAP